MIICRDHEFIFLKTRKTAGTSIEIALSRLCKPHDVVTKVAEEDEAIRREEGGFGPYNHLKPLWVYTPLQHWKRLKHGRVATKFRNHAGAPIAADLVSDERWQRAFKFTAERNPWSKAVSRYYWQKRRWNNRPRRRPFPEFEDYLLWLDENKPHWLSCWSIYTIDDRIAVDDFVFYEGLEASLERIGQRIGTPIRMPARHAKQRPQPAQRDYRSEFTDRAREIVTRACQKEIATFGYSFDAPEYCPKPVPSGAGAAAWDDRRRTAAPTPA